MKHLFLSLLLSLLLILTLKINWVVASPPIGNYLEFFGGYLKATTNLTTSPTAFTFEAWIRPASVSGIQHIASIGNLTSLSPHYEIGINGGSLSLRFRHGANSYVLMTAGNLVADVWSHIAVVISSSDTKLFVNGIQISSRSGADLLLPIGSRIVVGNSYLEPVFANNIYKGNLDEMRISDTVRDIVNLWKSGAYQNPLRTDGNTVILWHFDEQRGETNAFDASGNGFNGSLIGGDSKIHFFGVLPTPTPFTLPSIRWLRPVLPTLSLPSRLTNPIIPTNPEVTPTFAPIPTNSSSWRYSRPIYPR